MIDITKGKENKKMMELTIKELKDIIKKYQYNDEDTILLRIWDSADVKTCFGCAVAEVDLKRKSSGNTLKCMIAYSDEEE